jgi:hypothetical protein
MALLVMQVAVSGELVEIFEMPVDDVDGHRMLAAANEDERVIHPSGQALEDAWFAYFRLYGPLKPYFDGDFALSDFTLVR